MSVGPVGEPVEAGGGLQLVRLDRKPVRLLVGDHLHAMLHRTQPAIGGGEALRDLRAPGARRRVSTVKRVESCGRAQRRLAAAVDQLLHLGEELGLADAAAAALEVEARAEAPGLAHNGRGCAR